MAKKKVKIFQFIRGGSFPFDILFTVNMKPIEIREKLKAECGEDWIQAFDCTDDFFDGSWGVAMERSVDGYYHYFLSLHKGFKFSSPYDYCKLAHEVLHLCQFALPKFINRDLEFEAEAYTHTHIMDMCLDIMKSAGKDK